MRHHNRIKKFGRKRNGRKALRRTLAVSFFRNGRMQTTEAKAKAIRPFVERLLTYAKSPRPAARRLLYRRIGDSETVRKLCDTIAPEYAGRRGGYTRIMKTGFRRSDGAPLAIIEMVR